MGSRRFASACFAVKLQASRLCHGLFNSLLSLQSDLGHAKPLGIRVAGFQPCSIPDESTPERFEVRHETKQPGISEEMSGCFIKERGRNNFPV